MRSIINVRYGLGAQNAWAGDADGGGFAVRGVGFRVCLPDPRSREAETRKVVLPFAFGPGRFR